MKRILLPTLFLAFVHVASAQIDLDDPRKARDQVINDDLIVTFSTCVGMDCVNGESFGFSTVILKENNTRLKFFDTSTGTFPSNDWELEANESINGGANHFAINDVTGGKVPFKIIAGAPTNSLLVKADGNVGMGTGSPAVRLHLNMGNTPAVRLQQDGSNGFTPQTWDLAGNETNFFIRDVTNGSKLPFRIRPGAPENSIFIKENGNVGLGTQTPDVALHLRRTDGTAAIKIEEVNGTAAGRNLLAIVNNGPSRFTLDNTNGIGTEWQMQSANSGQYILQDNADPAEQEFILDGVGNLRITGDLTANGVLTMSDRRLKKNISDFNDGLEVIKELRPVTYNYNGKAGLSTERPHIGLIAQELQKVAPYLVLVDKNLQEDELGNPIKSEDYFKIDEGSIRYLLVNAIKEQQNEIESKEERIKNLEEQVESLSELKERVSQLEEIVGRIDQETLEVLLRGSNVGSLGQNIPNPYDHETKIDFMIPAKANSAAIEFFDISGKLLKKVVLDERGKGQLKVKSSDLPQGTYTYTLIIDNKLIDTKRMIVKK
ncbi:MAG: tail fiber domain-containing protein [Saprospiraceae bacterium]|nr:tail fiber domain-containing protein [Saprospiraceae bacterium]